MSFLPKNYEIPVDSNWMKFEEGENRFRVLNAAIVGTEYWTEEGDKRLPVRVKPEVSVQLSKVAMNTFTGEPDIKHFWMFPVWNYKAKKIQILELTQKTIMKEIRGLSANKKWGDPQEYDIVVTKGKDGGKTVYSTIPDPKEELTPDIVETAAKTYVNMDAIWKGGDPFKEDVDPSEVKV